MLLTSALEKIESFSDVHADVKSMAKNFLSCLQKYFPKTIHELEEQNIGFLFADEIIIEWLYTTGYVKISVRAKEIRLESKTPLGRFAKYHLTPKKIINQVVYCLQMIHGKQIDHTRYE